MRGSLGRVLEAPLGSPIFPASDPGQVRGSAASPRWWAQFGVCPLLFSHSQTGPKEPVPVLAPHPDQVGVIRRGRQGPQAQGYLEEKVPEMGSVALWRRALGRLPEARAGSWSTWG